MSAAKPVLIPIVGLCLIVMIMEGFGHAPWFKCNDVIRYGVWQWCASYVYFRFTLGKNDEDIYMSRRVDSVIDNNHYCHGYSKIPHNASSIHNLNMLLTKTSNIPEKSIFEVKELVSKLSAGQVAARCCFKLHSTIEAPKV